MSAPEIRPYGSWKSPITATQIAAGAIGLSEVRFAGREICWLEMRPAEGGRSVVVRCRPDGAIEDWLHQGFNARTRVHEYGGGSYLVSEGTLYFANFADQRLYRQRQSEAPTPLTPIAALRYADLVWDARRRRIISVREDHTRGGEPRNTVVALDIDTGGAGDVLAAGQDFYAAPRLSPDGSSLAWIEWGHPRMPWDAAELHVAPVRGDGTLGPSRRVAGGSGESATQPLWSPDGTLHFALDRDGWWNLYRFVGGQVEAVTRLEAEFAAPAWVFGIQNYGFTAPHQIVCSFTRHGTWHLATVDTRNRQLTPMALPYTDIASVQCDGDQAVFLGGSPSEPLSVVRLDTRGGRCEILRRSSTLQIDPGYLSTPEPIAFPTAGGRSAHGLFYPPTNPDFVAPEGDTPPLDRHDPRRSHCHDLHGPPAEHSVLYDSGDCRPGRELRGQHGLRPGVS